MQKVIMETATEQATNAAVCATATPMGWPEAFMYVGCAFAIAFAIYALGR